jgi:hypothetical protein
MTAGGQGAGVPAATTSQTVAIVQSSYIPWKGYFDLIRRADHFILYDDAQYTTRDWRNRNRIKTKDGLLWLSIPVEVKGRRTQLVRDARVADDGWPRRHWKTIAAAYSRAAHFETYRDAVEDLFGRATSPWLSEINRHFIEAICGWLGIATRLSWSSEFELVDGKSARLANLCLQAGASTYLSGPSARNYLDEALFEQSGLRVQFMDYTGYQEYPQVHPPFEHAVTALDLLFSVGPAAPQYLLPV